jgi:hypothetical protein
VFNFENIADSPVFFLYAKGVFSWEKYIYFKDKFIYTQGEVIPRENFKKPTIKLARFSALYYNEMSLNYRCESAKYLTHSQLQENG